MEEKLASRDVLFLSALDNGYGGVTQSLPDFPAIMNHSLQLYEKEPLAFLRGCYHSNRNKTKIVGHFITAKGKVTNTEGKTKISSGILIQSNCINLFKLI